MDITITKSDIIAEVKRSLSIIASRAVNEKGESIYSFLTLSSNEEPILSDFFASAFVSLANEMRDLLTVYAVGDEVKVSFRTRNDENLVLPVTSACRYYAISYILFSWFVITSPKLSEKYAADAANFKSYLASMAYARTKPVVTTDPLKKLTT